MLLFHGSGVSDTSESFCHLAESTLLSHDVVSDDFTWPTSGLIVRLNLVVGSRHRHRCERVVSQDTEESRNSSCIFSVLRSTRSNHFFCRSLQVCTQTSHSTFLSARFQASPEPQRCRFIVSESQKISIPDCRTASPLNPMTSRSLCHVLRYRVRHEYEYCDVCVNRSDDNMLDVCFQDPLHNSVTRRSTTLPIELINSQRVM